MTCVDDDCALKQYKKFHLTKQGPGMIRAEVGAPGAVGQSKLINNESNSLLLNFTKRLLEKSIRRFPKCTILKITYSNFLLDHMGNKREAMRELNECQKLKPSVD
jgi:hypothetical protein